MAYAIELFSAAVGSLGFSLLFNVRGRELVWTTLGGLLSWAVYLCFVAFGWGDVACCLMGGLAVAVYSELLARLRKAPATVFLVTGAVPLIPGGSLYYTMLSAVRGNAADFASRGLHTLLLAAAISAGFIIVSTFAHAWQALKLSKGKRHG